MHMVVAEQPAMAVVMPAVMARMVVAVPLMPVMVVPRMAMGRVAVMRVVVRGHVGMAVRAMIVLAFAHGAVSVCREDKGRVPS
ncbi:hypothetical protein AA16663_2651 [Komagataeibacter rhaeticus DSM 16663]|nr:hypothetical protein AA16663_2651 [Komagataeibacter rhaeticus DSM 16663]